MKSNDYSTKEEIANSVSHGLGTLFSTIALILLIVNALSDHNMLKLISFIIYGSSLIILFLSSTVYHAVTSPPLKKIFKLFDHCAIYLLIAGTYTPLMMITLAGTLGYSMLVIIWIIALAGISFKVKFGHQYKKLSLATYVGMGLIAFSIIHELHQVLAPNGFTLLVLGGAIYLLGVVFYAQKKIPFNHAIWHLFVLAGASCHFFMIYFYV